jgi:phosphohistidine phosphatase SixA
MKKIFVRKIFAYDPTFSGNFSRYEGYNLITLQKKSVNINKDCKIVLSGNITSPIYHSPLKRALQTAMKINKSLGLDLEELAELSEIKFNLKQLLTEEQFNYYGSNLVRKRFIEAFINDKLVEKRKEIKERINKLLKKLNNLPDGNYLLISHSFFMKLLQFYLKDKTLFENSIILKKYFNLRKKTFEFGKGFEFDVE